ncbi:MAG: CDP-glucose 4,6-dehydratase [bacterium]
MAFFNCYKGKRVLITGHTGFKGSWLAEWLIQLGADVSGFALPPPVDAPFFNQLGLAGRLNHIEGDVRNLDTVDAAIAKTRPEFVFHLAAQSLVRPSYEHPVENYATNVMGTVHVLDAIRRAKRPCAVVVVTSDKCYENREWIHSYREEDALGGYDPYSSSKGAAEIIVGAYRRSFFFPEQSLIRLASARAGNVIGGGDWALDRIVPDCIRSLSRKEAIAVRNKTATRPWQHVLEPLSGYLWLGACLASTPTTDIQSAFNFGPSLLSNRTVQDLVVEILKHWPGIWEDKSNPLAVHEARLLNLATDKAFHYLKWRPVWNFEKAVAETMSWYLTNARQPSDAGAHFIRKQIEGYTESGRNQGLAWAC